jgi:hypothetical protein
MILIDMKGEGVEIGTIEGHMIGIMAGVILITTEVGEMTAGGGVGPEKGEVQVEREMRARTGAVTKTGLGHGVMGRYQDRGQDHLVVGAKAEPIGKIIMMNTGVRDQMIDTETIIWMRETMQIPQWYEFVTLDTVHI